jgi:hypothetical protein
MKELRVEIPWVFNPLDGCIGRKMAFGLRHTILDGLFT